MVELFELRVVCTRYGTTVGPMVPTGVVVDTESKLTDLEQSVSTRWLHILTRQHSDTILLTQCFDTRASAEPPP